MPYNGEVSTVFGVFRTLCCDAEIVIGVRVPFPDCPNHKNLPTLWKALPNENPTTYVPKPGKITLSDPAKRKK